MDNSAWCLSTDADWPQTEQFYYPRACRVDYFVAILSVSREERRGTPQPTPFILACIKSKFNALWRKRPVWTIHNVPNDKRLRQSDDLSLTVLSMFICLQPLHTFHSNTYFKYTLKFSQIWCGSHILPVALQILTRGATLAPHFQELALESENPRVWEIATLYSLYKMYIIIMYIRSLDPDTCFNSIW